VVLSMWLRCRSCGIGNNPNSSAQRENKHTRNSPPRTRVRNKYVSIYHVRVLCEKVKWGAADDSGHIGRVGAFALGVHQIYSWQMQTLHKNNPHSHTLLHILLAYSNGYQD